MASAGPDLNFSVSELQQAGLLEAANIQQDDIFGPSLGTTSSASGNSSLDGSGGTQGRTGTETGPAARGSLHRRNEASSSAPERLADSQKETRALQGNYQIEPSSKKQAANRENQKRWRAKQKVPCCSDIFTGCNSSRQDRCLAAFAAVSPDLDAEPAAVTFPLHRCCSPLS